MMDRNERSRRWCATPLPRIFPSPRSSPPAQVKSTPAHPVAGARWQQRQREPGMLEATLVQPLG